MSTVTAITARTLVLLLDGTPRNSARRQLHRALVCTRSDPLLVHSVRARTKRSHHDLLYHTFTERSHARVILLVGQVAWDGFLVRRVGLKAPVGTSEPLWMVTPEPPPAPQSVGIASSYGSSCVVKDSNLVDPASSHTLVSKIKPCMSKYNSLYGKTANGSLYQL